MFFRRGGVLRHENDLSAKEKIQSKSSWIQSQNEYSWRKKSNSSKKIKRKKEIVCLGRIYVAFFLKFLWFGIEEYLKGGFFICLVSGSMYEVSPFRIIEEKPGFSAYI